MSTSFNSLSPFQKARITLTAWYVAAVLVITSSFSLVLYVQISNILDQQYLRLEHRMMGGGAPPRFGTQPSFGAQPSTAELPDFLREDLQEVKSRIFFQFVLVNAVISGVFAVGAYVFAGRTLRPIEVVYDKQRLFMSSAAHELRTPLATLRTSLELLKKKSSAKKTLQEFDEVLEDVDHLSSIVSRLLDLARYEQGTPQFSLVSLKQVVHKAVRLVKPQAETKSVHVIAPKSLSVKVHSDEGAVIELLTILLENAVIHAPPNSEVQIQVTERSRGVEIAVTDTGAGLTAQEMQKIFEPFIHASKNNTSVGLGLTIAQQLAHYLGTQVKVASQPHTNTTFSFTLKK